MEKVSGKKGQFYLLIAVIIIGLAAGILISGNYSNKQETEGVEDITKQLDKESEKVLELGANTGVYPWNSFTKNFSDYAGQNVEIAYLIINSSFEAAFFYNASGKQQITAPDFYNVGNDYYLNWKNSNYIFKKRMGENFYYVVLKEINGERYVATNN